MNIICEQLFLFLFFGFWTLKSTMSGIESLSEYSFRGRGIPGHGVVPAQYNNLVAIFPLIIVNMFCIFVIEKKTGLMYGGYQLLTDHFTVAPDRRKRLKQY